MHFRESWKKLRMHAAAQMWRNGRRNGLKIEVLAISLLFTAYQIEGTLPG
jgi:hypothetical protein